LIAPSPISEPKVRSSHCYDFVPRRTGPPRLIEEPKPHTKAIQCKILDEILARVYRVNYTRNVDDLTFLGRGPGLGTRSPRFVRLAERIIRDEGYLPHPAKLRVIPHTGRQRVTGIVVDRHVNIARVDHDCLRATLHNCIRHGPARQNQQEHTEFRAYFDGRVPWVEQVTPERGAMLR
jgi:RNA-directed DNA polymerase